MKYFLRLLWSWHLDNDFSQIHWAMVMCLYFEERNSVLILTALPSCAAGKQGAVSVRRRLPPSTDLMPQMQWWWWDWHHNQHPPSLLVDIKTSSFVWEEEGFTDRKSFSTHVFHEKRLNDPFPKCWEKEALPHRQGRCGASRCNGRCRRNCLHSTHSTPTIYGTDTHIMWQLLSTLCRVLALKADSTTCMDLELEQNWIGLDMHSNN